MNTKQIIYPEPASGLVSLLAWHLVRIFLPFHGQPWLRTEGTVLSAMECGPSLYGPRRYTIVIETPKLGVVTFESDSRPKPRSGDVVAVYYRENVCDGRSGQHKLGTVSSRQPT